MVGYKYLIVVYRFKWHLNSRIGVNATHDI